MISVSIMINGNPIMARSAVRGISDGEGGYNYKLDDGQVIQHNMDDGAVKLAIKMLETIKEQGISQEKGEKKKGIMQIVVSASDFDNEDHDKGYEEGYKEAKKELKQDINAPKEEERK